MTVYQDKMKHFLSKYIKNYDLSNDEDIFATGFVNSLLAIQMVAFVEREFNVKIPDAELSIDNFRSINATSTLIARLKGVPA